MRKLWRLWRSELPKDIVDKIVSIAETKEKITQISLVDPNSFEDIRKSEIRWINEETWIRDLLYEYIKKANRTHFNVDVTNFANLQYTEYHGDKEGQYNWHRDVIWTEHRAFDRKLSMTVQLSDSDDYEGGDFMFRKSELDLPEDIRQRGTILVFPSYLEHKVEPVTKGTRKSLVAWFEGPRWR